MKKLLWISPYALHDTSSGAATFCRTMLQQAKQRGVEVKALGSFIFDNKSGTSMFTDLDEKLKTEDDYFSLKDHDIEYIYVRSEDTSIHKWNYDEQELWYTKFLEILRVYKPDVVMGFGGDSTSKAARAELNRRGIPFVFVVCNGNYKNYSFYDCDMVITDSKASSDFYSNNFGINVIPLGIFIEKEKVVAPKREGKYITFINPVPQKGVSLVARLALMAQKELPNERFLCVKSRGDFATSIQALHLPNSDERPLTIKDFPNVDRAEHMSDVRAIYAASKIVIVPSLGHEGWGRVATEAVMNNIPCLTSTSGGLIEAISGAGISLDTPIECQKDFLRLPTEDEMRPWMDALKRILTEDFSDKCNESAKLHNIEACTDRLMDCLEPLFMRRASLSSQYLRTGISIR